LRNTSPEFRTLIDLFIAHRIAAAIDHRLLSELIKSPCSSNFCTTDAPSIESSVRSYARKLALFTIASVHRPRCQPRVGSFAQSRGPIEQSLSSIFFDRGDTVTIRIGCHQTWPRSCQPQAWGDFGWCQHTQAARDPPHTLLAERHDSVHTGRWYAHHLPCAAILFALKKNRKSAIALSIFQLPQTF